MSVYIDPGLLEKYGKGSVAPTNDDEEEEKQGFNINNTLDTIGKGLPIFTHLFGVFGNRPELLQNNQQNNQNNQQLALLLPQQNAIIQQNQQNQNRNTWILPVVVGVLVVGLILFLVLKK